MESRRHGVLDRPITGERKRRRPSDGTVGRRRRLWSGAVNARENASENGGHARALPTLLAGRGRVSYFAWGCFRYFCFWALPCVRDGIEKPRRAGSTRSAFREAARVERPPHPALRDSRSCASAFFSKNGRRRRPMLSPAGRGEQRDCVRLHPGYVSVAGAHNNNPAIYPHGRKHR
jgi:hypothetical protein